MTRLLTESEIDDILSFIPFNTLIPNDTAQYLYDTHYERFASQLRLHKIKPEIIPQIRSELERIYYKTLIPHGENVGIITAQSLGERQTQSTLNSFHKSGLSVKTVVTGVPRFQEIISATSNPKNVSCTLIPVERFDDIKTFIFFRVRVFSGSNCGWLIFIIKLNNFLCFF